MLSETENYQNLPVEIQIWWRRKARALVLGRKKRLRPMENTQVNGWILDEFVAPGATLTQGDLIKFDGAEDPLRTAGIVVTADCDLEQKKHARLVTLIPVVSVTILMENYLLLEDCEKKRDQIESYALRSFEIDRSQEPDARRAILRDKVAAANIDKDHPSLIAAKFATDQLDSIRVPEYKALMEAINNNIKKADALNQQILGRGDLLILPSLKKLGLEDDIAWVRHIWQVPLGSIAIRTSELKSRPGERIARLDSPFRYRLTQLMAQVFSDIGLPNIPYSIEERIKEVYGHA